MEMISNTVEFIGFLALAVWLGAPSARIAWARLRPRRDEGWLPPETRRDALRDEQ
jgi:hypothetical protein